ncbi:MAG: C40 family peptidase [Bacteroidota bacterium]
MKYLSILLALLLFACSESTQMVEEVIDEVRTQYIPDKRIALFEIEAESKAGAVQLNGVTNQPDAYEDLRRRLESVGIGYVDSIRVLPDEIVGEESFAVVKLSVANIRSQPKHSSELSTQATLGTPLKVYDRRENWYRIQTPDGYLGWLDAGGLELMNKARFNIWKEQDKVIYTKDFGFVYAMDSTQNVVTDLVAGNILGLQETAGDTIKVMLPDGRKGMVNINEVRTYEGWLQQQPESDAILAAAYRHLGRPYLWGGTSGKGMDCSGFTKTVFFENGLLLPRDASQQVHVGIDLRYDTTWQNLLPGDFLFFGRKATPELKERITHVAIYAGEGKIIHASGRVMVESLNRTDDDFTQKRFDTFVRAKRMLQSVGENGVIPVRELEVY